MLFSTEHSVPHNLTRWWSQKQNRRSLKDPQILPFHEYQDSYRIYNKATNTYKKKCASSSCLTILPWNQLPMSGGFYGWETSPWCSTAGAVMLFSNYYSALLDWGVCLWFFLFPVLFSQLLQISVNFPILPSWHGKGPASTSQAGFFHNPCQQFTCFVLNSCWPVSSAVLPTSPSFKMISSSQTASYFSTFYTLETNYILFLGKRCLWVFYMVV